MIVNGLGQARKRAAVYFHLWNWREIDNQEQIKKQQMREGNYTSSVFDKIRLRVETYTAAKAHYGSTEPVAIRQTEVKLEDSCIGHSYEH